MMDAPPAAALRVVNTFTQDASHGAGSAVAVRLLAAYEAMPAPATAALAAVDDYEQLKSTCTVFVRPRDSRREDCCGYDIQWFSPAGNEYRTCGHGTLAAGFALQPPAPQASRQQDQDEPPRQCLHFHSAFADAPIRVTAQEDGAADLILEHGAFESREMPVEVAVCAALGIDISGVQFQGEWDLGLLLLLPSDADVLKLQPDYAALARSVEARNIVVASFNQRRSHRSGGYDIVYRVFCPHLGVNEDSATGSSMVALTTLYAKRTHRHGQWVRALQASGSRCELQAMHCPGDAEAVVKLRGEAAERKPSSSSPLSQERI